MTDIIKSPKWDIEISSFVGSLYYAQHYMGRIERRLYQATPEDSNTAFTALEIVTLDYVLDAEYAKRLSTEDFTWHVGDSSTHFFSREAVVEAAIRAMDKFAVEGEWLEDYDYAKDEDIALWGELGKDMARFSTTRSGYGNPLKDIQHYLTDEENADG